MATAKFNINIDASDVTKWLGIVSAYELRKVIRGVVKKESGRRIDRLSRYWSESSKPTLEVTSLEGAVYKGRNYTSKFNVHIMGDVYNWLDAGVPAHPIPKTASGPLRFRWAGYNTYVKKTVVGPGMVGSRQGGTPANAPWVKMPYLPNGHPGIKPMNLTDTIEDGVFGELATVIGGVFARAFVTGNASLLNRYMVGV